MISNAVNDGRSDEGNYFVGHLDQHQFIIVADDAELDTLKKQITERVGSSFEYFYPVSDREPEKGKDMERLGMAIVNLSKDNGPFADVEGVKEAALKAAKAG